MNARSFFDDPATLAGATPPIWSVYTDSYGSRYVASDNSALENAIRPYFSPDPFASTAPSYSWSFFDRTSAAMTSDSWEAVFNPEDRWSSLYGCR